MQEASNILDFEELTSTWERLAPQEWQNLFVRPGQDSVYEFNKLISEQADGTGVYKRCIAQLQPCMLKCEGEHPTDDEVEQLFEQMRSKGEPIALLKRLSIIRVPEFPEGKDPTVKEFFEGQFDPSEIKIKSVIFVYPYIEVTQ